MIAEEFFHFYESNMDAVFRHCYYRTSDREVAQEIMQESFMKMWQYLAEGKEIENFRAFVYKTAHNLIIDLYRRKKETSLEELQEGGFEPSQDETTEDLQVRIDAELLKEKLTLLDVHSRDIIVLRYIDDFSPKQIAAVLNQTENVVSVRLNRAVTKFRNLLSHG